MTYSTDFKTWERATLEEFAKSAQIKILEQEQLLLEQSKPELQFDKELNVRWKDALAHLVSLPEKTRESFAMLILAVSDCFINEGRAGIFIFHRDSELTLATTGCTEFECAGIIQASNVVMQAKIYDGAPSKEMMN